MTFDGHVGTVVARICTRKSQGKEAAWKLTDPSKKRKGKEKEAQPLELKQMLFAIPVPNKLFHFPSFQW